MTDRKINWVTGRLVKVNGVTGRQVEVNGVTGRQVKVNGVTGWQVKVNEVIGRQVEVDGVTGRQVEVLMESLVAGSISIESDLSTCRWSSNVNGRQMISYWSQFSIQFNSFILSKPWK